MKIYADDDDEYKMHCYKRQLPSIYDCRHQINTQGMLDTKNYQQLK